MKKGNRLTFAAVVLCVAAAVMSYNLLLKHVTGSSGSAWFEAGCSDEQDPGGANCAAVLASPYSYMPAKHPGGSARRLHVPVALLGLMYYSALAVWFIGVGRPAPQRRSIHLVPLFVVGFGLAASVYFTFIMFGKLNEWCSWCMVTHVLNLLIAICGVLMWPRGATTSAMSAMSAPADAGAESDGVAAAQARHAAMSHPTRRVVWLTLMAIAAVFYGELNTLGLKTWRRVAESRTAEFAKCLKAVNDLKSDTELLVTLWQREEVRAIDRRPDDPVRERGGTTSDDAPLDVVVFSDFECPSCGRFARFFEKKVAPLFDGRVRLTFKHYPIDRACNPRARRTLHPRACEGARMAEAVRMLVGNSGFWKAHDYLFETRDDLARGAMTAERIAEAIGVDPGALREAMSSEEIKQRLLEDADLAKECDIPGTPGVLVEGKPVHTLAKTEIGFWDRLADTYWQRIGVERPESTRPRSPETTPDNPDPKDAP